MDKYNNVVLVDAKDNVIGSMDKNLAHIEGVLHRAVSVFIINKNKDWLIQKRAAHKYHSPKKWSNTCCTHPVLHESYLDAATRRLKEEMGIVTTLTEKFKFIYKAELDNDMIEHELDTVFFGQCDDIPDINTEEVSDYAYISYESLLKDISENSESYTPWFKMILKRLETMNINEHL